MAKWIDDSPDPRDLREALAIAWEALHYTKINWIEKEKRGNVAKRDVVNEAISKIASLGKGDGG